MKDDSYWDDDPNDPMPSNRYNPPPFPLYLRPDGTPDRDRIMRFYEHDLDNWFAIQTEWWERRLARERQRETPHPDTEAIARNIRT